MRPIVCVLIALCFGCSASRPPLQDESLRNPPTISSSVLFTLPPTEAEIEIEHARQMLAGVERTQHALDELMRGITDMSPTCPEKGDAGVSPNVTCQTSGGAP